MILYDLSLTITPGDMVILRGPNGAGKTTLLRALAGLLKPEQGAITVKNDESTKEDLQTETVFCGALNASKAALSVTENLRFWAALYGASNDEIETAISQFQLSPYKDYQAGVLSTGLARRLGLARLAIARRPIWLIDEPVSGLDANAAGLFCGLVRGHCSRGGIAVIATHDTLDFENPREFSLVAGEAA